MLNIHWQLLLHINELKIFSIYFDTNHHYIFQVSQNINEMRKGVGLLGGGVSIIPVSCQLAHVLVLLHGNDYTFAVLKHTSVLRNVELLYRRL